MNTCTEVLYELLEFVVRCHSFVPYTKNLHTKTILTKIILSIN